jgi:hypothetical protein
MNSSTAGLQAHYSSRERAIRRLRRARRGDIVLLHDGDHRVPESDRRHTVSALEYWLPRWKDSGLRFVTLEKMRERNSAGGKIE